MRMKSLAATFTRSMARRIALIAVLGAAGVVEQRAIGIPAEASPASLAACTAFDESLWQHSDESLGIFVTDDKQAIGGAFGAVKFTGAITGPLGNIDSGYFPVSGSKEMVCGTIRDWNLFVLGQNERDLEPHLNVSPLSMWALEGLPQPSLPCGKKFDKCMWGEVTVPKGFEAFWKDTAAPNPKTGSNKCGKDGTACRGKTASFDEGKLCMYGPWIAEQFHEFQPEIHPIQAFWGQSTESAGLFLVDDDSKRFDRAGNFEREYLSAPFSPWSGQNAQMTLYQVVQVDPAAGASVSWSDRTQPTESVLDTGAGVIKLSRPAALKAELASACSAKKGTTQAIIRSSLPRPAGGSYELAIDGVNTGIAYKRERSAVARATPEAIAHEETEAPWEIAAYTSWSGIYRSLRTQFGENRKTWKLPEFKGDWRAVLHHQLDVKIAPQGQQTLPNDLQTKWTVKVFDLDEGGQEIDRGTTQVLLDHDVRLKTTAEGVDRMNRRKNFRDQFALNVKFNPGYIKSGGFNSGAQTANLKVEATVKVWTSTHSDEHTYVIYELVPDALGLVSGYDLKKNRGTFPERLLALLAPLASSQGCNVTLAELRAEMALKGPARPTPGSLEFLLSPRRRAAGILRQAVNRGLGDRVLDEGEFTEMMRALETFRRACGT